MDSTLRDALPRRPHRVRRRGDTQGGTLPPEPPLSDDARDGGRAARARAAYAAYWLLLAVLLAFLPVLQSWEALPWGGGWTAAKLAILLLAGLLPIATRHEPRRHVAVVMVLLAAGIACLLVNLGLVGP